MRTTKNTIFLLLTIAMTIFLSSCSNTSSSPLALIDFHANDYLELYDYTQLTMSTSDFELSQEDINSIILINLSYNEIYKPVAEQQYPNSDNIVFIDLLIEVDNNTYCEKEQYYIIGSNELTESFDDLLLSTHIGNKNSIIITFPDNYADPSLASKSAKVTFTIFSIYNLIEITDTQEICNAYQLETMKDVYAYITEEAVKKIKLDHAYNTVIEKSTINRMPPQKKAYIEEETNRIEYAARQYDITVDEYLNNVLYTNYNDFYDSLESYFCEFMLLKAITETKNLTYSLEDYQAELLYLCNQYSIGQDELLSTWNNLDIWYDIIYKDVEAILIDSINVI